jgi:hypothetical protein
MKKIVGFLTGLSIIIIFTACMGGDRRNADPANLFLDYRVWGEEGNDSVTVLLQFRIGNQYGEPVSMQPPASVTLDGQAIKADSTPMTGPFYQVTRPVQAFAGKHSIVFTNPNRKKYKEEFVFRPFSLVSKLPDTISRNQLIFEFSGLANEDMMRILMTDTSYTGEGINRLDTVVANRLVISRRELSRLENGPIQLEFIREDERLIETNNWDSGSISVIYAVRREFFLKD